MAASDPPQPHVPPRVVVLFQDGDIVVVAKPAGLLVHPTDQAPDRVTVLQIARDATGGAHLEAALRNLINSWRGARDITIRAVGHADSQQITARSRKVYADNYALSKARAQTVANYLAISLNVPESRVHVEGHGSDEPVNTGMDAASLAANRRVEIVIERLQPGG
jgi:flagellar motor protein MotB